jgi:hypothetical protein
MKTEGKEIPIHHVHAGCLIKIGTRGRFYGIAASSRLHRNSSQRQWEGLDSVSEYGMDGRMIPHPEIHSSRFCRCLTSSASRRGYESGHRTQYDKIASMGQALTPVLSTGQAPTLSPQGRRNESDGFPVYTENDKMVRDTLVH